jgi:uncharacterized protein YkwD
MTRLAPAACVALLCATAFGQQCKDGQCKPAPNRLVRNQCSGGVCTKQYVGSEWENRVVDLTNRERVAHGLRPLRVTLKMMEDARSWSRTQAQSRRMYHSRMGYGENVIYGYPSPEAQVKAWMNSSGHRRNILNPSYTEIGVGVVLNGKSPYGTQVFR